MRGVADQRDALGDEGARDRQPERIARGAARPLRSRRDAGRSAVPARRGNPSSGSATMRSASRALLGPDDRGAAGRVSGRIANGPAGRKCSSARPLMIALMRHRGDDGGLVVAPAVAGDAGALADRRARAVGGDQQARGDRVAVGKRAHRSRSARQLEIRRPRSARRSTPSSLRLVQQRREQRPVLDHVRERLARLDVAVEGEEGRPHRVLEAAVGHHHVEDRLRLAATLSQTPMVSNSRRAAADDGRGARVARRRVPAPDRRP